MNSMTLYNALFYFIGYTFIVWVVIDTIKKMKEDDEYDNR